jgi:hypothetical protein
MRCTIFIKMVSTTGENLMKNLCQNSSGEVLMHTRKFVLHTIIAIMAAAILAPTALASHSGEPWYRSFVMNTSGSGSSRKTWTSAGTGVDAGGAIMNYTAVKATIAKSGVGTLSTTKVCNWAARCDTSSNYYWGAGTYQSTGAHWYQVSGHNRVDLPGTSSPPAELN